MASPAPALISDEKRRTTVTLPAQLLAEAEALAEKENTSVSAVIAQAMQAGMANLHRRERAQTAYAQLRAALGPGLSEEDMLALDGVRLTEDTRSDG